MSNAEILREQLVRHLNGGEAFLPLMEIVKKISFEDINTRPNGLPYSFYELFFHVMYTQKDIVKFTCSDDYIKPKWPDYYWPKEKICKNRETWENLIAEYLADRKRIEKFILDQNNLLDQPVKNGKDDQILLREVLLIIEHSAYHTGQMLILLRLLNLY